MVPESAQRGYLLAEISEKEHFFQEKRPAKFKSDPLCTCSAATAAGAGPLTADGVDFIDVNYGRRPVKVKRTTAFHTGVLIHSGFFFKNIKMF